MTPQITVKRVEIRISRCPGNWTIPANPAVRIRHWIVCHLLTEVWKSSVMLQIHMKSRHKGKGRLLEVMIVRFVKAKINFLCKVQYGG
jgi:hypothetical protein